MKILMDEQVRRIGGPLAESHLELARRHTEQGVVAHFLDSSTKPTPEQLGDMARFVKGKSNV